MGTYVNVPASVLQDALRKAGFEPESNARGWEQVWSRCHLVDDNLKVKVYTTIPANADTVRACGKDAIRVVAVDGERGVYKAPRVYRVGTADDVAKRMIQRAREAYSALNGILRKRGIDPHPKPCRRCKRADRDVTFAPDPYAQDISGDNTKVWMCETCRYESAQDI